MKKIILPLLMSIIIGFLLSKIMLDQYQSKEKITPVFKSENQMLYFLQQGVYSSKESMQKNTTSFPYYIYNIDNDKYYVYIGITKNKKNSEKIQGYYKEQGYITYVKEIKIDNPKFVSELEQYDSLLEKTTDKKSIGVIISQILNKYEEVKK